MKPDLYLATHAGGYGIYGIRSRFKMKLGVITGMESEAKLLRGLDLLVESGGGHESATRQKVERLVAAGADRILSFGIAGALDPSLRPGDILLATTVSIAGGGARDVDGEWLRNLSAALPKAQRGGLLGISRIVADPAEKTKFFQGQAARAVDMESHIAAVIAAEHGLPFAAIRAIADTAADELPPAVQNGLDENGKAAIGPVIRSLLSNPAQLPALIRVARQTRQALNALFGCRAALTL